MSYTIDFELFIANAVGTGGASKCSWRVPNPAETQALFQVSKVAAWAAGPSLTSGRATWYELSADLVKWAKRVDRPVMVEAVGEDGTRFRMYARPELDEAIEVTPILVWPDPPF